MLYISRLKLKQQLVLLIIISVVMITAAVGACYKVFYSLTLQRSEVFTDNVISQFEENANNISSSFDQAAFMVSYNTYLQQYFSADMPLKKIELIDYISNIMGYVCLSSKSINDIIIVNDDGELFMGSNNSTLNRYDLIQQLAPKYNFNNKNFDKAVFSGVIENQGLADYFVYIYPIYSTSKGYGQNSKAGTCIVVGYTGYFKGFIDKLKMAENSRFFLIDEGNQIIASNYAQDKNNSIPVKDIFESGYDEKKFIKKISNTDYIIQYKTLEYFNWKIVSMVPVKAMMSDMGPFRKIGTFIGFLMTALLAIVGFTFIRSITKPIQEIIHFIKGAGNRYPYKRLNVKYSNEISQIAIHINTLLGELEDMTRKMVKTNTTLYEMVLAKKQAELSSLLKQVNPHFLYNTLECIRSIAVVYNVHEIDKISSAMGKILRYNIKGSEFVHIRQEVDSISDYVSIIIIRYQGRFRVEMDIDKNILEMKTIRMVLQPIVENAMFHGLERKLGAGKLIIRGYIADSSKIRFEIIDDGKGIKAEELIALNESLSQDLSADIKQTHTRIGLTNTNKRIKHYFGDEYGIKIESKENEGTKAIINLPALPFPEKSAGLTAP
jgi:two-component system sensor histidine kinase YesM